MGTETPPSFFVCDVLSWLRAKGLVDETLGFGLGENGMGSVSIGRLRWGKQGPAARQLVQDGFLEVRVDRHGSHVGNPFCNAPAHQLCRAYDDMLRAVLVAPLVVDDGLHSFEGLRQDTLFGQALLSPFESELLQTIAERHDVRLHNQRVRPLAVRAWLIHHASLLLQGASLTLLCWCLHGGVSSSPWVCHSQSLMGALLWVAVTARSELTSACICQPSTLVRPLCCPSLLPYHGTSVRHYILRRHVLHDGLAC
jgi:hypothetical protein